jgi:hypothetical protein
LLVGGSLCLRCDELTDLLISSLDYLVIDSPGHHLVLVNLFALMSETLILVEAAALQALLHALSDVAALPHYGGSIACCTLGTRD